MSLPFVQEPTDEGVSRLQPEGRMLASAHPGKSAEVRLWDPATGEPLLTLAGPKGQVNGLAFSTDGSTLASCSHDGAVRLWRAGP